MWSKPNAASIQIGNDHCSAACGARAPKCADRELAQPLLQQVQHILRLGDKTPPILVGEDDLVVQRDLKDPAPGFNERGLESEFLANLSRQTDGFGAIVSLNAEPDANLVHGVDTFQSAQRVGTLRIASLPSMPRNSSSG